MRSDLPNEHGVFPGHLVSPADLLVVLTPANPDPVPGHVEDVGRLPPGLPLQRPAVVWRILVCSCHGNVCYIYKGGNRVSTKRYKSREINTIVIINIINC